MAVCFNPRETDQIVQIQQRLTSFTFRGVCFSATFAAAIPMNEENFTLLVQDMVDFLEEVEDYEKKDESK